MSRQQDIECPAIRYALDVECVATGPTHNDRSVAQIALVDQNEQVVYNAYVRPEQPVFSYLTELTGVTKEHIDSAGMTLAEAVAGLRAALPRSAVLVGQNVRQDVLWCGLREGDDFSGMMDLTGLFRVWNDRYRSYSMWSQDQLAKVLCNWEPAASHDASVDAQKSMRLFHTYFDLHSRPGSWEQACQALLTAPVEMSFARRNPQFEGVCMGNRKTCTCGAPFFS